MLSVASRLGLRLWYALPLGLLVLAIYYVCLFTYNIAFHPLRKYPGPRIKAAIPWWRAISYLKGTTPEDLLALHNRYGPVVRTAPNELSYVDPAVFKEIYGHTPRGKQEFTKDERYFSGLKGEPIILTADRHYHGYIRKLLAHGFSEKALRAQEPVIQEYVGLLFQKLQESGQGGTVPVDILKWYNFMTFDFIGFLTFGESFDCLVSSRVHRWVEIFYSQARFLAISQAISRFPKFLQLPMKLWSVPSRVKSEVQMLKQLNSEKINHRIEYKSDIPDFMDKLIAAYNDKHMTLSQLKGNGSVLIGAGSETTATLLSGLTYLLLTHPRVRMRLAQEVRGLFQEPEDITIAGVNRCKYLLACIEEALRVYPPSPQPHQRIVPPGGAVLNGEYVPEGVAVAIPIYAASRSPENWVEPDSFIPERWLGEDPRFNVDKREASQPFSYGPRNCIGRNLAYVEMKLITARLLWHFDVENATEGNWLDQRVYMVWEKRPLWLKLHPVKRI